MSTSKSTYEKILGIDLGTTNSAAAVMEAPMQAYCLPGATLVIVN